MSTRLNFFLFSAALLGLLDLSSQPGIKPIPPAMEMQGPNYWTTRESPVVNVNRGIVIKARGQLVSSKIMGKNYNIWSWKTCFEILALIFAKHYDLGKTT